MSEPVPLIYDDQREISAIWYPGEGAGGYFVGSSATRIVAYKEHGQSDFVPFYAVYNYFDEIVARVPAHMVTVHYRERRG